MRRGGLPTSTIEWFSAFVGQLETRTDTYLPIGQAEGLSVKIRGGLRLDIKVSIGDNGVLDLPGHARGRTQSWKKWSLPMPPVGEIEAQYPERVQIAKHRRIGWFSVAYGVATARASPGATGEPTCTAELTEVLKGEEKWWTLGLEAAGAPTTLRRTLTATAALLFSSSPPDGLRLHITDSMPYSEWLHPSDDESRRHR